MEFLRSFLKPHVSGSTKCRLFFSGYDLLSFFFQFELARKLKEPIQIIHYSARDNTYCQLHLISFPAVFLSSGQRVSTKRTLLGRGGGGGIILHGPIFAEARRAVHSYSKSDDSFDYGSIKSNVLIHLFPFERRDNE